MEIKEYNQYNSPQLHRIVQGIMSLGDAINTNIKQNSYGRTFDLRKLAQGYKVVTDKRNGASHGVKYNSLIPNTEMFSLVMQLVQPAIEEFEALNIFTVDTGFLPGADVVGFDSMTRTGDARLSARGIENGDMPRADISLGRLFQVIGKIDAYVKVTIDDTQRVAARSNAGLAPVFDLLAEKLNTARLVIERQKELLIWRGGIIQGKNMGVASLFSYFSTTPADYNAVTPSFAKSAPVATQESATTWEAKLGLASQKGGMYIMQDISDAINYVQRLGTYKVDTIIMTRYWMNKLATVPFSLYDSRPIIAVLRESLPGVKFVGTTALEGSTARAAYGNPDMVSLKSGFIAIDSRKENFVIADPEPLNFLQAVIKTDGAVEQAARMQSAGIIAKHVSAMAMGTGIDP